MLIALVIAVAMIFAVAGLSALAFMGISYLENRQDAPKLKPCCPAGLGCNDPDERLRHCFRALALRVADVDDGEIINRTWSDYCGTSSLHPRKKEQAKVRFDRQRDQVIQRRLQEMSNLLADDRRQLVQPGQPALPYHSEVLGALQVHRDQIQPLRGEILDAD